MGSSRCKHLNRYVRSAAVLATLLLLCGCASFMQGYEQSDYTRLGWLKVDPAETASKTGYKRLQNEIAYSRAVESHVREKGNPDYLFVPELWRLYLAYQSTGKVYEFKTSPSGQLLGTHDWTRFAELPARAHPKSAEQVDSQLSEGPQKPASMATVPKEQKPLPAPSPPTTAAASHSFPPSPRGRQWAVVISVSSYKDSRVPSLRYAEADGAAFYRWLTSQEGGRYAPAHVKLLSGRDATAKNIRAALFQWLKRAIEEDTVTIFFAGHGSPESPDSAENLYLLPYDVEYDNIPSTAFPMWDIETALKRHIKDRRVIVIADACHSGGVGQSFDVARRAGRGLKVVPVSSGLCELSRVSEGICVISASDDKQMSQEGKQWGGGHGVFTYFLIKGLEGDADTSRDGSVNLGELTLYVSQQVRRSTRNAQSPTVAGKFDPAMTIGKCFAEQNTNIYEDDNVGIMIDKVERTDEYPSEWKLPGYRYRSPKDGHDYFVVHFTIKNKKRGQVCL